MYEYRLPLCTICTACGECVDKLVMIHNESMQDVATLQNRLATLYDDLSFIYQQLNNVTLQAIPLMVSLLYVIIIIHSIIPGNRISPTLVWISINNWKMI